jgi:hypothetical protein
VEARAIARYIWIPPRKLRQVADLIRGKSVVEAMAILRFMPGKAAVPIAKALNSAAANAEHNQDNIAGSCFNYCYWYCLSFFIKNLGHAHFTAENAFPQLLHLLIPDPPASLTA